MESGESPGADRGNSTGSAGAKARRGGRKRRADERHGAASVGESKTVEFRLPDLEAAGVAGSGVAGGPVFAPCR